MLCFEELYAHYDYVWLVITHPTTLSKIYNLQGPKEQTEGIVQYDHSSIAFYCVGFSPVRGCDS